MRNSADRRQVFRYFRYFLALLFLAALVLSGWQYYYAYGTIRRNAATSSRNAFALLKHSHDILFHQIENSLSSLFNNAQFQYFMDYYHNNRVNQIIGINEQLNSVVVQNSALECLGLYYPAHGYTLSSDQSVSSLELYHDKDFLSTLEHVDLRRNKTFVREVQYALKGVPKSVITIVRTLPAYYAGSVPDAYVIIDIKLSAILAAFEQITMDNNASMMIFDETDKLISVIGMQYDIAALLGDERDPAHEAVMSKSTRLDGEDLLVYYAKSADTQWTYVYVQRTDEVNDRLILMRNAFFFSCIGVLALGGFYSWSASRKLYGPIRRISEQLGNPDVDVFERIDEVMLKNERLDHDLQDNLIIGRNRQMLQRMLFGFADGEHTAAQLNLRQGEKECALLLLDAGDEYEELIQDNLESYLLPHGVRPLFTLYTNGNELAILVAGAALTDKALAQSAGAILDAVAGYGEFSAGVSVPFDAPSMLADAYRQAVDALGMRIVRGPGSVCCFREIQNRPSLAYTHKTENAILRALKTQKIDNVRSEMDRFQTYLVVNDASAQIVRSFYMQLYCSLHRVMMEMPVEHSSIAVFNHMDLLSLAHISEMSAYIMRIYEILVQSREADDPRAEMIRRVCRYIESNLQSFPTTDIIASEFQISPTTLRAEFQRIHGISIKNYADQLRSERAKVLLAEGRLQIQDIARMLGFHYSQSFITFFKSVAGMTPGEYRLRVKTRRSPAFDETEPADEGPAEDA